MQHPKPAQPLTYAQAGVDVAAADDAVDALKPIARSTYRPEVLGDIGAFGSVTALPAGYEEPVLVTANDGAGTKPMIAKALNRFDTIGIDVVAMCVDDVVTMGAEPLLFQDQITMGEINASVITQLVEGMAAGCRIARCSLTGGEIAEHPDEMAPDAFDVNGFAVGVAERARLPQPLTGEPALLVGIASPGLRCNGFSLARRALLTDPTLASPDLASPDLASTAQFKQLAEPAWDGADRSLGDELLLPSAIYAPAVYEMFQQCGALAAAHITGGGLAANLERVLGEQADAIIRRGSWPQPRIFSQIQTAGPVAQEEMEKVFNLGVGMIVAVPAANTAIEVANKHGHDAWVIGEIVSGTGQAQIITTS